MIQDELFALQDTEYASFQSKLMPTVPKESIIGVRVPQLRKLAKKTWKKQRSSRVSSRPPA
jgi:DNA alkylation repair enzyme.